MCECRLCKHVDQLTLVGIAHTPKSKAELEEWIIAHRDPHVTTAYLMTYNFIISQMKGLLDETCN